MKRDQKLQILPPIRRETETSSFDAFHEGRIRRDLERLAEASGLLAKYIERARSRFRKAAERALLEHWIAFYEKGRLLIDAKTDMERSKSQYLQLDHEHEINIAEKRARIARAEADLEEERLRRDKAVHQQNHLEELMEQPTGENEQKMTEAAERRELDIRWEMRESLRTLGSLIELQHWRREQRSRILKDRKLSPEEQTEDLQFVDELYRQRSADLKSDTQIFED